MAGRRWKKDELRALAMELAMHRMAKGSGPHTQTFVQDFRDLIAILDEVEPVIEELAHKPEYGKDYGIS